MLRDIQLAAGDKTLGAPPSQVYAFGGKVLLAAWLKSRRSRSIFLVPATRFSFVQIPLKQLIAKKTQTLSLRLLSN